MALPRFHTRVFAHLERGLICTGLRPA